MSTITVLNTDAGLSGKTIVNAEDAQNVTGLKTYNRSPNAPFAVQAGSANVPNLDADKLDGQDWNSTPITIGGQVKFPATQVPSTDANTLDDYEEGTFVPVIGGSGGTSGQTYSIQVGHYIKIGKLVFVCGDVAFSGAGGAKGTITTNVQLQGLPFTSENTTNLYSALHLEWFSLTSTFVYISAEVAPNGTAATLYGAKVAAASLAALATADLSDSSQLIFSGFYKATA